MLARIREAEAAEDRQGAQGLQSLGSGWGLPGGASAKMVSINFNACVCVCVLARTWCRAA